jgi:hypothetical protein
MERELSRDGSHYSISSGILPSLGARSNRRVKLRPFIVSPYDRRYRYAARFPPPLRALHVVGSEFTARRCCVSCALSSRVTPSLGGLRPRGVWLFVALFASGSPTACSGQVAATILVMMVGEELLVL